MQTNPTAGQYASRRAPRADLPLWVTILRWVPFVGFSVASLWRAGRAPDGRRDPQFDWTVNSDALLRAMTKWPHITSMLLIFSLAVIAIGSSRLIWCSISTLIIGIGWEVSQLTVIGHNPRVADLLPDLIGIAAAYVIFALFSRLLGALKIRKRKEAVRGYGERSCSVNH